MPAGRVDFNKTCEDHKAGAVFPPADEEVLYRRCIGCGFVWAPELCAWPKQTFKDRIYNTKYALADPDYTGARAANNAKWLVRSLPKEVAHLDYGGGSGELAALMRDAGYATESFDVMNDQPPPLRRYDVVTAFEVLEHAPNPRALRDELLLYLRPGASLIFSTLTSDSMGNRWHPSEWWYAAPRNGHVCLYTQTAMRTLFHPLKLYHLNEGLHMAQ